MMQRRKQTTGISDRGITDRNKSDGIRSGKTIRTEQQTRDWVRLIRDQRWSNAQKLRLLDKFQTPAGVYRRSSGQITKLLKSRIQHRAPVACDADIAGEMRWLAQSPHSLITINDSQYPVLLKQIHDPPIALFAKGDLTCLGDPKVAIVGSRRPSPVGSKFARMLAHGLADIGVVVTSGMALGIDGAAHLGAIDAGSPTVAVMGCGLDTIYPPRHRELFEQISTSGCLLSEYPLGAPPSRYHFPVRNRIVSGLSLGVIVIEAAERSGTLVTARLAIEQNRELMVVPGSALSQQYQGSHSLIKQGAAIVTRVEDVVELLSTPLTITLRKNCQHHESTAATLPESPLLTFIGYESTSVDEIILASGLTAAEVSSMLLMLEVEGSIATADDGGYVRLC